MDYYFLKSFIVFFNILKNIKVKNSSRTLNYSFYRSSHDLIDLLINECI